MTELPCHGAFRLLEESLPRVADDGLHALLEGRKGVAGGYAEARKAERFRAPQGRSCSLQKRLIHIYIYIYSSSEAQLGVQNGATKTLTLRHDLHKEVGLRTCVAMLPMSSETTRSTCTRPTDVDREGGSPVGRENMGIASSFLQRKNT